MAEVLFKDNDRIRLSGEFNDDQLHRALKAVLFELSDWLRVMHDSQLVVTCLYRTPDENKAVGGVPKSAHLTWRAADIRTFSLKPEVKEAVATHLQTLWPKEMLYVLIHKGGTGEHLHININMAWAEAHKGA